ncbi:expressed unknown protein [Seminavis robusta]|uniref:Uncharacterized protein n=1 Tax=Seminavis robusta TaxID=568900 RepID=A0A9N8E3A9_9STRA|nr:expressed unknown protein [Seminavis robusta]|eukprot:Sro511_g157520.1 n/a (152) ;mRNA; f:54396-54851
MPSKRNSKLYSQPPPLSPPQQRRQQSESWEDFHQQYHSEQFRYSANNPSILRRMGSGNNAPPFRTFLSKESSSKLSLVDQILLRRDDSMSSCSSNSGSERGRRMSESAGGRPGRRRRCKGNIKIGQPPKQAKTWTFPSLGFSKSPSSTGTK